MAAQENGLRFVCAPEATGSLRDLKAPEGPVSLLVGPEGGFEEGELLAARAAGSVRDRGIASAMELDMAPLPKAAA